MRISTYDIANTLLSAGFVLMWIANGQFWYEVCTADMLGHVEDIFGWISTVTMLCSAFSGLLTLTYLVLASHVLAHLKKRDVQKDTDDGRVTE